MSCRRTQEIDLLEFLANPRDVAFDAFREHYPVCPECASEVRVWTELYAQLGAGDPHPAPDLLLRFEDAPDGLSSERRTAIERHVASCATCRDELRALRAFDPSAAAAPVRAAAGGGLADALAWLRHLLWHPALAYALVFILLVPLIAQNWDEVTRPVPSIPGRKMDVKTPDDGKRAVLDESSSADEERRPVPEAPRADAPARAGAEQFGARGRFAEEAAPQPGLASRLDKSNLPAEQGTLPSAPKLKSEAHEVTSRKPDPVPAVEPLPQAKARGPKRREADALDAVAPLAQAEEDAPEIEPKRFLKKRLAPPPDQDAQEFGDRIPALERGSFYREANMAPEQAEPRGAIGGAARAREPTEAAATPVSVERILPVTREGELLVLAIPNPTLGAGQSELEAQVVHANGRRRLRELLVVDQARSTTELRIPAALFEPGTHAVVVRVPGDPPAAIRQFDYLFQVPN